MAIPALPAAKNTDDIIDNAWVDDVRALLQLFRDDRPAIRVRNQAGTGMSFGEENDMRFSDGAGAFTHTPTVHNVGGWTAATGGNFGVVVPQTGLYFVSGWASFQAKTGGGNLRRMWLTDTGTEISGTRAVLAHTGSASIATSFSTGSALRFLTAGTDTLGMRGFQSSDDDMEVVAFLTAYWIGSSAS